MADTKTCSFCGEEILAIAVKCKHCQSMLDGSSQGVSVKGIDPFSQYHTEIQGKKKGRLSIVGFIGIVLGTFLTIAGFLGRITGAMGLEAITIVVFGAFMAMGCYSWARR